MNRFLKASEVGTGGASALAGHYFTSSEIFREEQEKIFARRWLCVGREEQIGLAGDFFLYALGNESIIVLRDDKNVVRAFYNVCRHRGTRLCDDSVGKLTKTIQCPYHAWTYALDGRLLGAPSMEGVSGFDKGAYALRPVSLALWEGFIWISLAADPEPFVEAYAPLLDKFARYNLARLRSYRQIQYDVRANWKLVFENYSECYHCPSVHPTLVELSPADSGENDLTSGPFLGGFMIVQRANGSMSLSGDACSIPIGDLPEEDLHRVYYYSIFPNMLLSLHADYVMVHTLHPISPERTLINCQWLFHPDAQNHANFNPDDGVNFWDVTNRQDWHMCELSQLGVASRAYTPGPYSPRESISAAFDREWLAALGLGNEGI